MKVVSTTHRQTKEGRVRITKFDSGVKVRQLIEPSESYKAKQAGQQTEVEKEARKRKRQQIIEEATRRKLYAETEKELIAAGIIDDEG